MEIPWPRVGKKPPSTWRRCQTGETLTCKSPTSKRLLHLSRGVVRGCWCTLWWTNSLLWKDPPFLMGKSTINGHWHVEDYSKSCTPSPLLGWSVPILTGRRGKMTHRHSLQRLFFGLAKQKKKHFHSRKCSKKKEHHVIATKKNRRQNSSVPKPHVRCAFYQRGFLQMSTPPRAVSGRAGCFRYKWAVFNKRI